MILNGSAHVFLILKKKTNKQSLKMILVHTKTGSIAFQCSIAHHIALNEVQ